jgi:hypothetical protein
MPNPKALTIGNSSNSTHRGEQVQSIVTLRSGKQVDNKVGQEEEDHVEPQGKESGGDKGKKLSLLEPYLILRIPRGHLFQKPYTQRD